jgi:hypothetical protein
MNNEDSGSKVVSLTDEYNDRGYGSANWLVLERVKARTVPTYEGWLWSDKPSRCFDSCYFQPECVSALF